MATVDYKSPIPTYWSKAAVEHIGTLVAEKLGFAVADPIEPVISKLGGHLKYGWNSFDEVDGGSILATSLHEFTVHVSELTSSKRDRFTIAHELGHLILHLPQVKKAHPESGMRATRHVDNSDKDLQRAEWEANWFAAELLMPKNAFRPFCESNGFEKAATVFNVSVAAAKIRASSLGL